MNGIVSRLSALGKVWLGLAAGALALIVFGLAAPGSGLFFPLLSLWCNTALFALALLVLRRAGVELDLFHKAVLVGVWAVAALYFFWALGSRTFLYYWDYVNYILKQYNAEAAFAQSTGAGFRFLLDSITEDYTNFIPLFTEFPFCLSGKTGDDYAFCQLFSVLPSLLVLLAGLVCKAGQLLQVKNTRWYFLIGFSWCVTFPFLRMSAMLGQPDWFGLIFAFMLLLLTLDYRFDRIDLPRCLLIFAATAGVILTRRWYLYFVVGYCFAYVLLLVVSSVRLAKSGQQSRAVHRLVRLAVFGLCAAGAMVLLLLPMVRKILGFDYAGRYSYYNFGGITLELAAQTLRIGLLNFILIGLGALGAKTGLLRPEGKQTLSNLLVNLVVPAMIINSYRMEFSAEILHNLMAAFALSTLSILLGLIITLLFTARSRDSRTPIFRFACVFSNAGYMGLPLISALFGSEGLLYASAFFTMFNLLLWTVGYSMVSGSSDPKKVAQSLLHCPAIYAIVVGLVLYLLQIPLPDLIVQPMELLGDMNTPLSMLITGMLIASGDLHRTLTDQHIWKLTVVRMLFIPVLTIAAFAALGLFRYGMVTQVILLLECCPAASITSVFAVQFHHDEQFAAGSVVLTTLLSILFLPLCALIITMF